MNLRECLLQRISKSIDSNIASSNTVPICLVLFVFALTLRVTGIHYGYWNGDERVNDAAKALTGQLVPGQHFYPPLFNYILAVAFSALYAIGRLIPVWNDTAEFRNQYFADPTAFYLTARFVTACMGAAVAPLFYLISREVGVRRGPAIAAGIVAAMIPINVLLSHIAKSDVPLATMLVAIFFVFLALPLAAWHVYWLAGHYERTALVRSLALSAVAFAVSWALFNIGIVLDFNEFLAYQAIQAQMSIRESGSTLMGMSTWLSIASDIGNGITPVGVLLYFVFPVLLLSGRVEMQEHHKRHLLAMWASLLFAMIVIVCLTGSRQPPGLWLPAFTGMALFAALTVVLLINLREGPLRIAGIAGLVGLLAWTAYGDGVVLRQALAKPVKSRVSELIKRSSTCHKQGKASSSKSNVHRSSQKSTT